MRWKRSLSVQEERAKIQVLRGTFQDLHEAPWPMRGSSSLTGHGLFIPHAMSLPWGCRVLNKFIKILSFEWVGEKVASLIVYIQLSQVRSSLYIYLSLTSCWNSWLWFSSLNRFLQILKEPRKYLTHIHFILLDSDWDIYVPDIKLISFSSCIFEEHMMGKGREIGPINAELW